MSTVRNVLFIMCDQLRRDHLSCYGGRVPTRRTSTRWPRAACASIIAYVQSGVCGPSRMSFYTGRYMSSHGATWNRVPLSVAEPTLGDYLRAAGTHGRARRQDACDAATATGSRASASRRFRRGALLRAGGFVELDRYDGHTPPGTGIGLRRLPARARLRERRSVVRLRDRRERSRPRRLRLAHAQRAPAGARRGGAFRDRLHDRRRARLDPRAGRHAVGAAPLVRQAALALHGAGAYHAMFRGAMPARSSAARRTARPTSIPWCAPIAARRMRELRPRRRGAPRAAGLHGPDRADRRAPRPPVARARRRWAASTTR